MNKKHKEASINNYIFIVQVLFSLMVVIIIFKYFGFQLYNFNQAFSVTLFLIMLLMGISYYSLFLEKKNTKVDLAIVLLDFFFIVFLFLTTGYFELRFLFIIPIIISAIKFNLPLNIAFSVGAGLINLLIDLLNITRLPANYSIETDLMFLVIYVMIGWLVGSFVKIEKKVRRNLYKTQERLVQQSALLKNLINEMPLCIVVIDKKERIVHINQVALDYAGIQGRLPEEFVGLPYKDYTDILFKNNYVYQDLLILDTLHTGKSYFKEKVIRNNMIIEGIYQPIYDLEDSIVYVMAIFYDITSEELINERLRNLEKMTLVGQMGASIAHEIKNPLTTIKGFLQLAEKSSEKLSKTQLDLLISEIERCNSIITDFLSISKKSTSIQTMCNLKNILERQLILIERDAMLANVKLHVDLDDFQLKLNENEMKQLILNLTHNALEAMSKGGNLYIRLKEKGENVILEIEDDGDGIPKEILEKVGTPFLTTKKNGTGLGLSVCQRIAEAHGAGLKITSELGRGTKVIISFPKELKGLEP